MAENETTPLLRDDTTGWYPANRQTDGPEENTPLLGAPTKSSKKQPRRWASGIAIVLLAGATIAIVILAFILPDTVQEYAQQAAVVEPTNLSLDSITTDGVRARVQADFRLDGSRVKNQHVRRLGRAATWVAYQLGTEETEVVVHLPDYDNVLLGSAVIPPLVINLRDGDTTKFDFVAEIRPGSLDGIRTIANEWLDGRLKDLRLQGKADVNVKSGIFPLGTHTILETLVFEGQSLYQSFAALYFGEKVFS